MKTKEAYSKFLTCKLFCLILILCLSNTAFSQNCGPSTPSYTIDMTGKPDSIWASPSVTRNDVCCNISTTTACVLFTVTIDQDAAGLKLEVSGGIGATYYSVNCGPQILVGDTACLTGSGPFSITVCKPGGNAHVYTISSIPKGIVMQPVAAYANCPQLITIRGLQKSTITWNAISDPAYNAYLSCTIGCDSTYVTFPSGFNQNYVDYEVTGYSVSTCYTQLFRDTVRAEFINPPTVTISPDPAIICFGSSTINITANPAGGTSPYTYSWSSGQSTQTIAVTPGTYVVSVQDKLKCLTIYDTIVVTTHPQIIADAGTDIVFCADDTAFLNGYVSNATGGVWSGGSGFFIPDSSALSVQYVPDSSEIAIGSVILTLTTTGNSGCSAATDNVTLTINPLPFPLITGPASPCINDTNITYQTNYQAGNSYSWNIDGGTIISGNTTPTVVVEWNSAGNNSVSLTETINLTGCKATDVLQVTTHPKPSTSTIQY
jgi:large repetitive protein